MNIYKLEKLVASFPNENRTQEQTELAVLLYMHQTDNFMQALEALKLDERELAMVYGEKGERAMALRDLITKLEEVKV